MDDSPPPLPELREGHLDAEALDRYARDLGEARILGLRVKGGPAARAQASTQDIGALLAGLRAGTHQGVQVDYEWEGTHWRDTLLAAPGGVRLVRMAVDGPPPPG